MITDVFFDGERLNVRLNRQIYKKLLKVAKEASYFEYAHEVGVMSLPPTKRIARILHNIGLHFDSAARIFLRDTTPSKSKISQKSGVDFSLLHPLSLRPYQEQGVTWMLENNINFILGDEMGLGKTIQIAAYLFYKQAFPALIICPASLKLNWEREVNIWTKKKCIVLEGREPYPIDGLLKEFPVVIINYDILGRKDKADVEAERKRIQEAKKRKLPFRKKMLNPIGWVDVLKQIPFKNIICDESQFIGEMETARSLCVMNICKTAKEARRIFLSGTPYTSATRQFFPVLHLVDSKTFSNKWRFQMEFCDPVKTRFGWDFRGLSNGEQLHNLVSGLMLRRLKSEVLSELPEKIKSVVPMKLSKTLYEKYRAAEISVFESQYANNEKGSYQHLKQEAYFAKIDSCIQWVKEYLEINNKLVVFCYHRKCFEKLMNEFSNIAVGINGETAASKRQNIVDQFQNDKKIKLFVGQIRAAGVGLTLTAASAVAFIEFGDTASEHEQAEDRIHRIGQKENKVIAYYLIAQGTIDEDIIENIKTGYANQKQVLDGVNNAEFLNSSQEVFAKCVLKSRKTKLYNNV